MDATITFNDLVCERCGFIHEPDDLEACVPVPTDEVVEPAPDDDEL